MCVSAVVVLCYGDNQTDYDMCSKWSNVGDDDDEDDDHCDCDVCLVPLKFFYVFALLSVSLTLYCSTCIYLVIVFLPALTPAR